MTEPEEKIIPAFPTPDPPDEEEEEELIEELIEEPEPEPDTEASKDDPDLKEEEVPDEPTEYTQEEWDDLPEDQKAAILAEWEKHEATLVATEEKSTENIAKLEAELRQRIDETAKMHERLVQQEQESQKLLTKRTMEFSEAAKAAGTEVKDSFSILKEIGREKKDDPNRVAVGFKPKIYYKTTETPLKRGETPDQHYQRVSHMNLVENQRRNEEMLVMQDYVVEAIKPIMPLIEENQSKAKNKADGDSWFGTFGDLQEEFGLDTSQESLSLVIGVLRELGDDLFSQGSSMSPESREVIARSMLALKQSGIKSTRKTAVTDGKVIQFSGKVPPGKLRATGNGRPPRRPPNTIAGRGTSSKSPSKKSGIVKDAAYYFAGGT